MLLLGEEEKNIIDKKFKHLDDALSYYSPEDIKKLPKESIKFIKREEDFTNTDTTTSNLSFDELSQKCSRFISHINNCPQCRRYVLNNIKGYSGEYLIDILIYALTGTFILFLIDMLLSRKMG